MVVIQLIVMFGLSVIVMDDAAVMIVVMVIDAIVIAELVIEMKFPDLSVMVTEIAKEYIKRKS